MEKWKKCDKNEFLTQDFLLSRLIVSPLFHLSNDYQSSSDLGMINQPFEHTDGNLRGIFRESLKGFIWFCPVVGYFVGIPVSLTDIVVLFWRQIYSYAAQRRYFIDRFLICKRTLSLKTHFLWSRGGFIIKRMIDMFVNRTLEKKRERFPPLVWSSAVP